MLSTALLCHGFVCEDELASSVAMMDGFLANDIHRVAARATQRAWLRREETEELNQIVTSNDIEAALEGFVPSALHWLPPKPNDVKWEDIGGLRDVKKVLFCLVRWFDIVDFTRDIRISDKILSFVCTRTNTITFWVCKV